MLTIRPRRWLLTSCLSLLPSGFLQAQDSVPFTTVCEGTPAAASATWTIQREEEGDLELLRLTLDGVVASHGGFVISGAASSPDLDEGGRCVGGGGAELLRLPISRVVEGRLEATVPVRELETFLGAPLEEAGPRAQAWLRGGSLGLNGPTSVQRSSGILIDPQPVLPNVLMIVVDDIGFEYLRSYHDENIYDGDNPFNQLEDPAGKNLYPHTPLIDALAERSLRFTQFHVNSSCSATRAMMYTGRYSFRTGIGAVTAPNRVGTLAEFGVGPGNDEFTLAEVMGTGDYITGFAGKWHLAIGTDQLGLDGNFGTGLQHVLTYGGWDLVWSLHGNLHLWPFLPPVHIPGVSGSLDPADDVPQGYFNFASMANYGLDPPLTQVLNLDFVTDVTRRRSLEMVDQFGVIHPDGPWFQVQCYNAAHSPWGDLPPVDTLTTAEYWPAVTLYGLEIPGGTGVTTAWSGFCAHVESIDYELAEFFNGLGGLEAVLEDTMVFFLSENGSPHTTIASATVDHGKDLGSVYPLISPTSENQFKNTPYDRGSRVPFLVAGPLVKNPGTICRAPVSGVDLFPTLAEIAGVDFRTTVNDGRPVDGVSFLSLIDGTRDDLSHIEEVRDNCLVERFSPNGDPRLITPPLGPLVQLQRGYLGRTSQGWFKLIRSLEEDGTDRDELYWLYDTAIPSPAGAVDPFELHDLMGNTAFDADYTKLSNELEALLATEP